MTHKEFEKYLKTRNIELNYLNDKECEFVISNDDELTEISTYLFYKYYKFIEKTKLYNPNREIFTVIFPERKYYFIIDKC